MVVPQTIKWLKERAAAAAAASAAGGSGGGAGAGGGAKPWFLYLPFHLIHGPNQVPDEYMKLYPTLDPTASAASQGMCGVCECANPPKPAPPASPAANGSYAAADGGSGSGENRWPRLNNSDAISGPASMADISSGNEVTWSACHTVLAMAAALDWGVGAVVDALHETNQWNNTIIIYTSDNGVRHHPTGNFFGGSTRGHLIGCRVPLHSGILYQPILFSRQQGLLPLPYMYYC